MGLAARSCRCGVALAFLLGLGQAACGDDGGTTASEGDGLGGPGDNAASSGSSGGAGNNGSGAGNNGGGMGAGSDPFDFGNAENPVAEGTTGVDAAPPEECVGETQGAERVDVDMYIMLDRSGSMLNATASGTTKWDAVRVAIGDFVGDAESDGLGVGLQYFPLGTPGVPEQCEDDADCGMLGGICTTRACLPPPDAGPDFAFQLCGGDADCPGSSCAPYGICSLDTRFVCFGIGAGGCDTAGDCLPPLGECTLFASCEVDDYATPDVPIDTLPGNAMALVDSLLAAQPVGLTPTPAALLGAIEHTAAHAAQNPTHRVITVLATDGLPTDCFPPGVTELDVIDATADIAAQGLALTPSIQTYVIGVFAPEELPAMGNLDQLAAAGGTERAFIVDAAADVSQQFLDVLAEIRGETLACEFQLPQAPGRASLVYDQVNVEFTDEGATRPLLYVQAPDRCGDAELGWHYDVDPESGVTPSAIQVCPETCEVLQAASDATIDIRLGCATMRPD